MAALLVDEELLMEIANSIVKDYDCTQLAVRLKVNSDEVKVLKATNADPRSIAFGVLKKWNLMEGANKSTLYGMLNKEPFEHLARKFRDRLQTGTF